MRRLVPATTLIKRLTARVQQRPDRFADLKMVKSDTNKPLKYSAWMPRFWHGMPPHIWFSALARHPLNISPSRLHHALGVTLFTPFNAMLALTQQLAWGSAIERTDLTAPPLFILGHWRSGTTLLHEYLSLDSRFTTPTTYECFAPWHFLLTERLVTRFGGFLIPDRRPMDNMQAGWKLPQEDEFALMNLGAPSPYLRVMFPNEVIPFLDTLSSSEFTPRNLDHWKRKFVWFLKALTLHNKKRLLLKSPPHTGRVGILHEMLPEAKFVHIVRDPRKIYPSTMKLWRSLDAHQALQAPSDEDRLKRFVLESMKSMYAAFEQDRPTISNSHIIDISYESFVANPIDTMSDIYDHLELGEASAMRPLWERKQAEEKGYQTNKLELSTDEEAMVLREWANYAKRYGYLSSDHSDISSERLINSAQTR